MGIEKISIHEEEIKGNILKLINQIKKSDFRPDLVVGLARGGLYPAQYIAYGLDVNWVESLSIQLRDNDKIPVDYEINTFLQKIKRFNKFEDIRDLNILVVDDLIDTGNTLKLIREFLFEDGIKVKVAALYQNTKTIPSSNLERADYWAVEKPDGWLCFPWDSL
jgi:hypoxanthine phosphoribosyltransferase